MGTHYLSNSRIMVEVDLPKCTRTYGVAPCTAAVGVTGTDKCFNCIRTCQDRLNYEETTLTLRLADSAADDYYLVGGEPKPVITNIKSISITSAIVKPGIDAGERETINISCIEHYDSDTQLDPYVTERSYNPMTQGTFWQRLRSRYVTWEGFPLRLYRGYAGQDRDDMDCYHYSVTSITSDGTSAKITAKDPFTLADSKKSQAPRLSNGLLLTAIDADDTTCTLTPTGVGNSEYPASGKICLSGSEVCTFTRSGDVMTIVRGSNADEHDAGATVQLVLSYAAVSGAAILHDLLTNYAEGIDSAWIDLSAWQAEIDSYYGTLFTADIAAPTSVAKLCNELIAQLPAVFWWDSIAQQFRLQALRPADPAAPLLDNNYFMEGSFKLGEQPDARADTVWTYFGQVDPTKKLDEVNNYATTLATVDPESAVDYNTNAIKTVYSRWIPSVARGTAQVLNSTLLSRYRDPPRQISFGLWRNVLRKPKLGDIYRIQHPYVQDIYGAPAVIPVQLCVVKPDDSSFMCTAQEVVYVKQTTDAESGRRYIYIDNSITDINLRTLYDQVYASISGVTEVHLVIGPDAALGGSISAAYALTILDADWPGTVAIFIDFNGGYLLGMGGQGLAQAGGPTPGTPAPAGHALKVDRPITITGNGIIGGGGGAAARWVLRSNYGLAGYFDYVGGSGGAGWQLGANGSINIPGFPGGSKGESLAPTLVTEGRNIAHADWTGVGGGKFDYYVPAGKLGEDGRAVLITQNSVLDGSGNVIYGTYNTNPTSEHTFVPGLVGNPGLGGHAIDGYAHITFIGSGIDVRGTTT